MVTVPVTTLARQVPHTPPAHANATSGRTRAISSNEGALGPSLFYAHGMKFWKPTQVLPDDVPGSWHDEYAHLIVPYGALNERIGDRDAMMWQSPAMALTAQAFLVTISLGHETAPIARF